MDSKKNHKEVYESTSMPKAINRYHELNDLIASISTKLSHVYNHNEKEFLSAYRVHTVELQSELRELKEKVESAEASLHDDDTVAKLEHEVNWFSGEANRLRNQTTSMKKDMQSMNERIGRLLLILLVHYKSMFLCDICIFTLQTYTQNIIYYLMYNSYCNFIY